MYILRIIILFLILFNFKLPGIYNSAVLSIIISSLYYLFVKGSFSFEYFFKKYNATVLIGLILLTFITISITVLQNEYDYSLTKALILQFFLLSCVIYAMPILIDDTKEDIFERSSALIVWTFALQGFIILLCFLIPSFGDYMISIKPESYQEALLGPHDIYFRGYALSGSPFFELPAAFGVAFILFIRIIIINGQRYFRGVVLYVILFLLLLGIFCTGRTAFIGVGLGLLLVLITMGSPVKLFSKALKIGAIFIIVLLFIIPIFLPRIQSMFYEDVIPFAFEALYNYQETGDFTTTSTDMMAENHYFALSDELLMHGDGRFEEEGGGYHMGTDAGYMRSIIYGGVFFTLALIIYQLLYFIKPISLARRDDTKEDKTNLWLFLLLLIHLFILEVKGMTIGTQQIMQVLLMFIFTSYIASCSYKRDEEEEDADLVEQE